MMMMVLTTGAIWHSSPPTNEQTNTY